MDRSTPLLRSTDDGWKAAVGRRPGSFRSVNRALRVAFSLALAAQFFVMPGVPSAVAQKKPAKKNISQPEDGLVVTAGAQSVAQPTTQSVPQRSSFSVRSIQPASGAVVNFKALAAADAKRAKSGKRTPSSSVMLGEAKPEPLTINDTPEGTATAPSASAPANDSTSPAVASPSPAQNFLAQEDGPKIGTTSFTIPPDTMGAVGLDKVFTQTNSNFRIHDKATGVPLSTVNSDTFWAPAGGTGTFDPRVLYDPYNNRWITAITTNAQSATSSVEIGISDTPDPQGSYHLYRFIVGCAAGGISPITGGACNASGEWADFPMLGFSKGWVSITWNQFTNAATPAFIAGRGIFIDYPNLLTGPATPTSFTISGLNFCTHPATTLDPTQVNQYFAAHISSGGATYQIVTLSGNPPSLGGTTPSVTATAALTRPGGGWTQPSGDNLPQTCTGVAGVTCPTTLRGIDAGDAFIRSNVIYRNGNLYWPQNIALPTGGITTSTRFAEQWTEVNASTGAFVDGGRVQDPTATRTGPGEHYAYGGIAVNKNGDILLGFSNFSTTHFANAAYSFRAATDPAGTMRDPVVYKAGEDYYSKDFNGPKNRFGDYAHAAVDPSNDRDMWVIDEYAGTRTTPNSSTTTNNSRWGTWWAKVATPAGAGDLIISEFKLNGVGADGTANTADDVLDEFIEIFNTNSTSLTVITADGSAGYAVAASDGVIRCTIPNGTVIPGWGHYLCVNSGGYSYGSYPAGNGTTATGDATYTADIPTNAGIAIFNTANTANFSTATRLDAVGSTSEANTLYKEGAGYPAIVVFPIDYSFYRDMCGKQGSTTLLGPCRTGLPIDTNDNATDFIFVDTNGTNAGAGQHLGAPGPENLSSPINRGGQIKTFLLDRTQPFSSPPNQVRDATPGDPQTSSLGTIEFRRRWFNNTGTNVTRLRFRVVDMTTFPVPSTHADLRAISSTAVVVSGIGDSGTCPGGITPCTVTVQGTTLETPPAQPNGGGLNSTLSAGTVTLATPVAPGTSINLRLLLGVQNPGTFKFFVTIEALP